MAMGIVRASQAPQDSRVKRPLSAQPVSQENAPARQSQNKEPQPLPVSKDVGECGSDHLKPTSGRGLHPSSVNQASPAAEVEPVHFVEELRIPLAAKKGSLRAREADELLNREESSVSHSQLVAPIDTDTFHSNRPRHLPIFEENVNKDTATSDITNTLNSTSAKAPTPSNFGQTFSCPFEFRFSCHAPRPSQAQPINGIKNVAIKTQAVFTAADVNAAMVLFGLRSKARVFRTDDTSTGNIPQEKSVSRNPTPERSV